MLYQHFQLSIQPILLIKIGIYNAVSRPVHLIVYIHDAFISVQLSVD